MEFRSGEAMMAFGSDLRVVSWNAAAEVLTGIPEDDAVGRYCWEVLGSEDEQRAVVCHAGCSYARLAREGWPVPTRRLWVKSDGGRRLVSVATVAVRGGDHPLFLHLMRNGELAGDAPGADAHAPRLTARQQEILGLLADGVPAKVIASRLGLSETTVRNHIRGVLTQLGCHSQLEAVATARRLGVL
jgi:PAS domain S-box-containing protein